MNGVLPEKDNWKTLDPEQKADFLYDAMYQLLDTNKNQFKKILVMGILGGFIAIGIVQSPQLLGVLRMLF